MRSPCEVRIPETIQGLRVTAIDRFAFLYSASVTKISAGTNLTDVLSEAFRHCTNLVSVTLGENVSNTGHYAFVYCTRLKTTNSLTRDVSYFSDPAWVKYPGRVYRLSWR